MPIFYILVRDRDITKHSRFHKHSADLLCFGLFKRKRLDEREKEILRRDDMDRWRLIVLNTSFRFLLQFLRLVPQIISQQTQSSIFIVILSFSLVSCEYCTISIFLKAPMAMSSSFLPSSWNFHCRTSALFLSVVLIPAQILTTEKSPLLGEYLFSPCGDISSPA